MSRYELSLDMGYVPHWGVAEGVREFFQNAYDEETEKSNDMFFNYDKESQILRIGNKSSVLDKRTLLLGSSTKRDNDKLIGQQGEGYKVATLVLLRTGHTIKIFNYGAKEVWTAKVVKSRKYKADIVAFDIEKYVWKKVPEHNLIFEIGGISEKEYNKIVKKNLILREKQEDLGEIHKTVYGDLLCDSKFKGQVYVAGLYVTTDKALEYGYNFKPEVVSLDRDRSLIDNFDLQFATSKILRCLDDMNVIDKALSSKDGEYYSSVTPDRCEIRYFGGIDDSPSSVSDVSSVDYFYKTASTCAKNFVRDYGENAYPVSSESEKQIVINNGYKPVITSYSVKNLLKKYDGFNPKRMDTSNVTLSSRLSALRENIYYKINDDELKELDSILDGLKNFESRISET